MSIQETLHTEAFVEKKLACICPFPLIINWHENRHSFLSSRKSKRSLSLRLHRLFLFAPSPVLEAVMVYVLRGDKKAKSLVRQMAHLYFSQKKSVPDTCESLGRAYDLKIIRDQLNQRYFSPELEVSIGWSPRSRSRARNPRYITLGRFDPHCNQIRIHPFLDDVLVPLYFVEFVVYHEMLHAICPSRISARGSIHCHTPEFRRLERQFADFDAAKRWEKERF